MSERVQAWQVWKDKRGELRTVVEVTTNGAVKRAGQISRKRVIYRDAAGVETSCRLDKFMRWRDKWGAVIVESEAAK